MIAKTSRRRSFQSGIRKTNHHKIGTRVSSNGCIIFRTKRSCWKTFDAPQKNRSSAQTLSPPWMNGDRRTDFLRLYQAIYVGLRLRQMGIDHVHAHFAGMAARTAFWINKFFSITFSFTAHANDIFSPRQFEIGLDKLVDTARAIVTETDYAARFLRERFSHRADRVHRIYNGLDLAEFGRADFSSTPPLIIAVGRLIPKKGFGDLIRACALLSERGKSFRCEIIGEGPLENELRRQIDELRLQNNVELPGAKPQTQLRGRLAAANVFVLPSVIDPDGGMDNLPTVIMEAMATGLPVVSTNIGGIPEMVIENETGFLVQPGDAAAMADAIETVINDCSLAAKLGQSGYERARALFSIEKNVRELCALLNCSDATRLCSVVRFDRCEPPTPASDLATANRERN